MDPHSSLYLLIAPFQTPNSTPELLDSAPPARISGRSHEPKHSRAMKHDAWSCVFHGLLWPFGLMRSNVFKCGFSKVLVQHAFGEHFFQPTVPCAQSQKTSGFQWISWDFHNLTLRLQHDPYRKNLPSWWRPYSHRKFHPSWPCAFRLPAGTSNWSRKIRNIFVEKHHWNIYSIHILYIIHIYIYYNYTISYIISIIILAWRSFASKKTAPALRCMLCGPPPEPPRRPRHRHGDAGFFWRIWSDNY